MPNRAERKESGARVRSLRERMNLDRYQIGKLLGLSSGTVKNVELGQQNLGAAARLKIEELEQAFAQVGAIEVAETPAQWGDPDPRWPRGSVIRACAEIALHGDVKERAAAAAKILNLSIEEAAEVVVEKDLERIIERRAK